MAKLIVPLDTHTVYMIAHPDHTLVYYGCTDQSIEDRFRHHLNVLERGYHGNHELQAAYDGRPTGWLIHQIAKLPEDEAFALETELIEGDQMCFNVQKNPRKLRRCRPLTTDQFTAIADLLRRGGLYQYQIARIAGVPAAIVSQISRGVHSLQRSA